MSSFCVCFAVLRLKSLSNFVHCRRIYLPMRFSDAGLASSLALIDANKNYFEAIFLPLLEGMWLLVWTSCT